jgi:hypothetical protein
MRCMKSGCHYYKNKYNRPHPSSPMGRGKARVQNFEEAVYYQTIGGVVDDDKRKNVDLEDRKFIKDLKYRSFPLGEGEGG